DLTLIDVYPAYGGFGGGGMYYGPAPAGGGGGGGELQEPVLLTFGALDEIRAIPGVKVVIPRDYLNASVMIRYQRMEAGMNIIGIGTDDLSTLGLEAAQGTTDLSRGSIVIGVMTPNNFYDPRLRPGQEPPPPPELLNEQIQLVAVKWDQEGNEIRKTLSLRVAGILNETGGEADWSVYLPLEQVKALNEWAMGTRINYNKTGYSQVIVKVEDPGLALDIADQITEMGFQANTPQSYLQGINSFFLVLQIIFGGVGAIALLVAAIGIANTMAMSILERTREIGLMKSVGATNRDVLSIFLGEAAGIGFIGGVGGVVIGWLSSQAINVLAIIYLAGQASEQGGAPPSMAVYTPLWLPIFALVFSTFIGMASGLYPALRAATMIPVQALKYE
ncbi:MAG: ABC transporter permease, partial [Chloroflexi bacterium]|nr:ABC transporter permease [Chloroflexota bacterium]